MKTEITILSGGKEFKYYSDESIMYVLKSIEDYGFIELSERGILKVSKNQLMVLKEVDE